VLHSLHKHADFPFNVLRFTISGMVAGTLCLVFCSAKAAYVGDFFARQQFIAYKEILSTAVVLLDTC
jgi:hypothetical protein